MIISMASTLPTHYYFRLLYTRHNQPAWTIANVPMLVRYAYFGLPKPIIYHQASSILMKYINAYTFNGFDSKLFIFSTPVPYLHTTFVLPQHLTQYITPLMQHKFTVMISMMFGEKSLQFMATFLRLLLQSTPIRQHPTVLVHFQFLMEEYIYAYLQYSGVGIRHVYFSVSISGKFGVVGNSRKRTSQFSIGLKKKKPTKHNALYTKYRHRFFLVSTPTGVLGIKVKFYVQAS